MKLKAQREKIRERNIAGDFLLTYYYLIQWIKFLLKNVMC